MVLLAIIVRKCTLAAVWLIVVAIFLTVFNESATNDVVVALRDGGSYLATPVEDELGLALGDHRLDVAVSWGIAAVAYGLGGRVLVELIAGAGRRGRAREAL